MADKADKPDPEAIEGEVVQALQQEGAIRSELSALESELREVSPRFQQFIEKQAELRLIEAKNQSIWDQVEARMIENSIKSIKGNWGSLTIAERTGFNIDKEALPKSYFKSVPNEAKIRAIYKLENKLPKGVEVKITKYLVKKFKDQGNAE